MSQIYSECRNFMSMALKNSRLGLCDSVHGPETFKPASVTLSMVLKHLNPPL